MDKFNGWDKMFENDWLFGQIEIIARALSVSLLGRDNVTNIMSEDAENKDQLRQLKQANFG